MKELNNEVFLVEQDVDIESLEFNELSHGLDVGILTSQVQWSCQLVDMALLVQLVLLVVFYLMHTHIGRLNRIDWEKIQDVVIVLLNCHGEGFFEHKV